MFFFIHYWLQVTKDTRKSYWRSTSDSVNDDARCCKMACIVTSISQYGISCLFQQTNTHPVQLETFSIFILLGFILFFRCLKAPGQSTHKCIILKIKVYFVQNLLLQTMLSPWIQLESIGFSFRLK